MAEITRKLPVNTRRQFSLLSSLPGDSKSWKSPDEVGIVWQLFIQMLFR